MVLAEILLAAAGNPSSLTTPLTLDIVNDSGMSFSESEFALIKRIARLGSLKKEITQNSKDILIVQPSAVCRAVASAVLSTHLVAFCNHVSNVQQQVLQNSAQLVGVSAIVSLSGVLAALNSWPHKLDWLKTLTNFIQDANISSTSIKPTGKNSAQLIDWLRNESRTGYPELEGTISDLVSVAESTWLRQASAWLLYGILQENDHGKDFLVQRAVTERSWIWTDGFIVLPGLAPKFVTSSTAKSMLFIGKLLYIIQHQVASDLLSKFSKSKEINKLVAKHREYLSAIGLPIRSTSLDLFVGRIRLSLAQTISEDLLPLSKIKRTLHVFNEFSLLMRTGFATGLIRASDDYLALRFKKSYLSRHADAQRLQGTLIKENELSVVLSKAVSLSALCSTRSQKIEPFVDQLDFARDLIYLRVPKPQNSNNMGEPHMSFRCSTKFDDVLLGAPAVLTILPKEPMMNLVISQEDTNSYCSITMYLLSIRRSHMHLVDIWALRNLRRNTPSRQSSCSVIMGSSEGLNSTSDPKYKISSVLRPTWATMTSAVNVLSELDSYLHGEVIRKSHSCFQDWLENPLSQEGLSEKIASLTEDGFGGCNRPVFRDLETVATAHRQYLLALKVHIFLADEPLSKTLRGLCFEIDQIKIQMERLDSVWIGVCPKHMLELSIDRSCQVDAGLLEEVETILRSISLTEKSIRDSIEALVVRIWEIDKNILHQSVLFEGKDDGIETGFLPWKCSDLGALLIKLDRTTVSSKLWS